MRNITGMNLRRQIEASGHSVKCLFLSDCKLWRETGTLDEVSNLVLSITNRNSMIDISETVAMGFYRGFRQNGSIVSAVNNLFKYLVDSVYRDDIAILFYANRKPDSIHFKSLDYLQYLSTSSDEEAITSKSINLRTGLLYEINTKKIVVEEKKSPRIYRVWFGTNRNVLDRTSSNSNFGTERSETVSYGHCDITVPKYHEIGTLGEVWWKRFPKFWKNNRLAVHEKTILIQKAFWLNLRYELNKQNEDERTLLFFLHGYNVGFDAAALRAAQLGFDLGVLGETAFFSWPSKGNLADYPADIASIEASESAIGEFLVDLTKKSGATKVNIIAHSMGNRGLLRAFSTLFSKMEKKTKIPFHQIVLAAPDVDADLFSRLAGVYKNVSLRTTMYVSGEDAALSSSGLIHKHPRAGYTPPVTVVPGVDTVDVSGIDLSFLGHGYVAENRTVLADMYNLLETNTPPSNRFGLEEDQDDIGNTFWRIRR